MLGIHCIAELSDCPSEVLDDVATISEAMRQAIDHAGATLLNLTAHHFEPCGVTVLAMLAESHMSVHTWPEQGYAAADLFTCGAPETARGACAKLAQLLGAGRYAIRELARGPADGTTPAALAASTAGEGG